jgi:hypothetical protein
MMAPTAIAKAMPTSHPTKPSSPNTDAESRVVSSHVKPAHYANSATLFPSRRCSLIALFRFVLRLPAMVLLAKGLKRAVEGAAAGEVHDVVGVFSRLAADNAVWVLAQLSITESTPTLAPVKRAAVGMLRCVLRPTVRLPRVSKAARSAR